MAASHDLAPHGDDGVDPERLPPEDGYELYRHKNAGETATSAWHGYYWARRTGEGDYEIRSVPSTLGERSAPGGVFPREGFEEHYEKVDLQDAT